ncbi:MAG: hypothetical protein PHT00_04885 [Candidatus Methanomethylophilus sp.]|nr:hypothetical protein [Methanomethylophilus sp.]MDD3233482.1 hypothetical protein [Methanomethylophilus sp.]MDD4222237.1 hypothetical protein [Methanomethylophilus sp.]MDD4668435.1 hypothetical protein [Methanomethylophilus sp.]
MSYETAIITERECADLRAKYAPTCLYTAKADLNGLCIQLYTSDHEHLDMWRDNFYAASDWTRSHARLFCVADPAQPLHVDYDPVSSTAFLYNFTYYGWVKSIALGVAGCLLETEHGVYSVHGAALTYKDRGITFIAPPKTGKTTQSWGLLCSPDACLISDDWFFVTFGSRRPHIRGSEKNCYIDADIGDVWEEYKPLIKNVKFDQNGRGIANIRWVTGVSSVVATGSLYYVILLQREPADPDTARELSAHEATEYMLAHDFCNPHQLIRDPFRISLRTAFFKKLFGFCRTYLVNTTGTPQQTQAAIRRILEGDNHDRT